MVEQTPTSSPTTPNALTWQALKQYLQGWALANIPFYRSTIISGARSGKTQYIQKTFTANTDTDIAITLGRVPNGYLMFRSPGGGVLYDASDGTGHWTPTNIRLRATANGTYWMVVT